jgi:hypothetical protein
LYTKNEWKSIQDRIALKHNIEEKKKKWIQNKSKFNRQNEWKTKNNIYKKGYF